MAFNTNEIPTVEVPVASPAKDHRQWIGAVMVISSIALTVAHGQAGTSLNKFAWFLPAVAGLEFINMLSTYLLNRNIVSKNKKIN